MHSKTLYQRLFKELGIRKNKGGSSWNWVDHRITKRKEQNRKSALYIDGKLVPDKKVKKEVARHVSTYEQHLRFTGTFF